MKTAARAGIYYLIVTAESCWFFGGAMLIALNGNSEGHVSAMSGVALWAIIAVWILGMVGGSVGLVYLFKPRKGGE